MHASTCLVPRAIAPSAWPCAPLSFCWPISSVLCSESELPALFLSSHLPPSPSVKCVNLLFLLPLRLLPLRWQTDIPGTDGFRFECKHLSSSYREHGCWSFAGLGLQPSGSDFTSPQPWAYVCLSLSLSFSRSHVLTECLCSEASVPFNQPFT